MAQIIKHPNATGTPIAQTRWRGRFPKYVISLNVVKRDRWWVAYKARLLQEEIEKTMKAADEWASVSNSLRYKAAQLQSEARGVKS